MVLGKQVRNGLLNLHQSGELQKAVKTWTSQPFRLWMGVGRAGTQTALLTAYFL